MTVDMTARAIHDRLLAEKPEGASHDEEQCPFCTSEEDSQEENVSEAIFTQEQHEQLLASAVEKAEAEATTTADAELLTLNQRVETLEAEQTSRDERIAELEAEITKRDEEARLAEVAEARLEKVKEVASFTDEQLEARKQKWAALPDEDFEALLEDFKAVSAPPAPPKREQSKFNPARETAGDNDSAEILKSFFGEGLTVAERL